MKKIISFFMAMLLVAMTTACSGNGSTTSSSSSTSYSSSSTEASDSSSADLNWPTKNINFIVTHSAGGDTDYFARLIGRLLEDKFNVSVVSNNVTGSNGGIALEQYKNGDTDGYTFILSNTAALTANKATGIQDFGYEAFEVVSIFGKKAGENIVVPIDSPYNSLEELVEASKANPNSIKIGVATGSGVYVAAIALQEEYGAQFAFIESGDAADRMASLLGGHVDVTILPYSTAREYIEAGQIKSLCTLAEESSSLTPDIKSAKELGFDKIVLNTQYICLAPKGTDPAIVNAMSEAILDVVNSDDYAAEVNSFNFEDPWALNAEDSLIEIQSQEDFYMSYEEYLK